MNAKEAAQALRQDLKELGLRPRDTSVTIDRVTHSMQITVRIRRLGIPLADVEAKARRYEDVRRDEKGATLLAGNRYVEVSYDEQVLEPLVTAARAALVAAELEPGHWVAVDRFVVARTSAYDFHVRREGDVRGGRVVWGLDGAARAIARAIAEEGRGQLEPPPQVKP